MARHFPYQARAARARMASEALNVAAEQRRRTPGGRWDKTHRSWSDWEARAEEFWAAMREVTPPGFDQDVGALRRGDVSGVDAVIDFLEADPVFFRSGYLKSDLVRWIGRAPLGEQQVARLRRAVLKVVAANWRREFRRYCALARRLADDDFRADLERLAQSSREDVRRRAARVLRAMDGEPWRPWRPL